MPTEIEAWARLNAYDITPLEVDTVFRLDVEFRNSVAEKEKRKKK